MGKIRVDIPQITDFVVDEFGEPEFQKMRDCDDPTHSESCEVGFWNYPSGLEIETVEMDESEFRAQLGR